MIGRILKPLEVCLITKSIEKIYYVNHKYSCTMTIFLALMLHHFHVIKKKTFAENISRSQTLRPGKQPIWWLIDSIRLLTSGSSNLLTYIKLFIYNI